MTVIACKKLFNGFEISADSMISRGDFVSKLGQTDHTKLLETNGVVVGSSGTCEETGLFDAFMLTNTPEKGTVSGILEFIIAFSEFKNKKINVPTLSNHYIIGFNYRAFLVEGFSVMEIMTYSAIGSGYHYATAALHMGASSRKAVEVSNDLCSTTGGKVITIAKRNRKIKKTKWKA